MASEQGRAGAVREAFGALADGTAIERVTLRDAQGITARVMTLGASLQSLLLPDRDGRFDDVVLGHDDAASYLAAPAFFGASVGRYANRIAGGRFTIDGREYQVPPNDGANALHGGAQGFDKRVWRIEQVVDEDEPAVTLAYRSPDGEQGFPGTLDVTATYTLLPGELRVDYTATTDAPTIVNITNHSYFDLGAGRDAGVMDHRLTLHADAFTPVDAGLIPTGERRPVAGTPFDFREPCAIGARIRDGAEEQLRLGNGYDHNLVLAGEAGTLRPAARIEDDATGRVLDLLVTSPGIQFYSGNFLTGGVAGKNGRLYRQGDGMCLEPQLFPDSPNRDDFASPRLDPGDTYRNTIAYRFSTQ